MYKGTITTSTAVTANQNIPFNTILNTNSNTDPSENGVTKLLTAIEKRQISRLGATDTYK